MDRGVWAPSDALYWFFYIPLTALVIILLVTIPKSMVQEVVHPIALDAEIMQERLVEKIVAKSAVFGAVQSQISNNWREDSSLGLSEKRQAYNVSYEAKGKIVDFVGNKDQYDEMVPFAGISFDRFVAKRKMWHGQEEVVVTVDQIFPRKYEQIK